MIRLSVGVAAVCLLAAGCVERPPGEATGGAADADGNVTVPSLAQAVRDDPLRAALAKVEEHVEDALGRGARTVCGGRRARPGPEYADRFYAPTVLADVPTEALVWNEETFGPVAPVLRFRTEEEAVALANDTIYGLAAYFYTRDAGRLLRVAEGLDYGIVGANDGAPSTAQAPFGGMKQSGFGREGGRYVMHEYLETKFVSWGL